MLNSGIFIKWSIKIVAGCVLLFNLSRIFAAVICGLIWTAGDSQLEIGNVKCGTWLFKKAMVLIWWWSSADHWIRKLIKPCGIDMLKVLMHQHPFSVYHTAFLSILGLNFTPKTIYLSIDLLLTSPMSSSRATESAQECLIHPFKTFRASMDKYEYALFESEIIHPSIWAAWSHTQLFNNSALPDLPIVFKPGHQSITKIQHFLVDTDCNWPLHNLHFPLVDPVTKMSSHVPLDCMLTVYSINLVMVLFFFWPVSVQFLSNHPKWMAIHFGHVWHQSFWQ